jgi:anti-anti-sigma regulatory factor
MMRVELGGADASALRIHGRVAGCFVAELAKAWRETRIGQTGPISVDLSGVTFVDAAGERLLRTMHSEGACFLAGGLLIQEIVNQITGESK